MKTIRMKTIKILMISIVFLSTTISVAQKTWSNNRYNFNNDQSNNKLHLDINDNTPNAVEFRVGNSIDYMSFEAPSFGFKGNLGVGTTSPSDRLEVDGYIRLVNSNSNYLRMGHGGINSFIDFYGVGNLDIRNNNSTKMTFSATGKLGLGTSSPSEKLDVNGSIKASGTLNFSTTLRQKINLWNNSYGIGTQNDTQYFRTGKNFAWYKGGVHSDEPLDPGSGGTAHMVLKNGDLGVGTTNPSEKLDVNGSIRTSWLKVGDIGGYWGGIHSIGEKLFIGSESGQAVYFTTHAGGNEARMAITAGGDVGVGTTNPSEKLDVKGNIASQNATMGTFGSSMPSGAYFANKVMNTDTNYALAQDTNGDTYLNARDSAPISFLIGNALKMKLYPNGNLGIGTAHVPSEKLEVVGNVKAAGINLEGDGANTNTIDSNINGTIVFGGEDGSTLTNAQIADSFYPDFSVWVEEGIVTEDIAIAPSSEWDGSQPDYVFETDYELPSLEDVEAYVTSYKHLEGIPSKAEVAEKGWSLPSMDQKLLKKVEELTLYTIQQEKEIKALKALVDNLVETIKN